MFRIEKTFTFNAAHRLPCSEGKSRRLHGHTWKLTVEVEGEKLTTDGPHNGMLVKFDDLDRIMQTIRDDYLDHQDLNVTTGLKNPTCEAVAEWAYLVLEPRVRTMGFISLVSVRIEENDSSVTYRPTVIPDKRSKQCLLSRSRQRTM